MALQTIWLDGNYPWNGFRRMQSVVDAVARAGVGSLLEHVVIEGHDLSDDLPAAARRR